MKKNIKIKITVSINGLESHIEFSRDDIDSYTYHCDSEYPELNNKLTIYFVGNSQITLIGREADHIHERLRKIDNNF